MMQEMQQDIKMKISKRQLRRIIREEKQSLIKEFDLYIDEITHEEAEQYLRDRVSSYKDQGLNPEDIRLLIYDDFIDDLGHQHSIEDFKKLIKTLILGEAKMKITKNQLRRIIREGLLSENLDWALQHLQKEVFRLQGHADFERARGGETSVDMGDMYDDDANDLQAIHDDVKRAIEQGEPYDLTVSREIAKKMDTSPREKIPQQIYHLIFPELK